MRNKKATVGSPWIYRLFKQSGTSVAALSSKKYYAHRYDSSARHGLNPFSDLFLDAEQNTAEFSAPVHQADIYQIPDITSPISINRERGQNNPSQSLLLTVVDCYDETPDTKTFHLSNQTGQALTYMPGQYITLSVMIGGREYKRSYSLASSPSRPRTLEITVKRSSNGGIVSNWLHDNLKIGSQLTAKGPYGKFSCLPETPQKILFIAAGSGIVPIMSMLRWLTDTHARVDVESLLSFRTPDDIVYGDELQFIATRHNNISTSITLTVQNIAAYDWFGLTGRIDEHMLQKTIPDLQNRAVFLCGPETFMTECKKSLLNLLVPAENVFCESFTVNHSKNDPGLDSKIFPFSQASRKPTGSYQINFAKSGKTATANGTLSLLELAEQSGIMLNYECRSGNCGECMVKCVEGSVNMTEQAEIDDINRRKGWVYSCSAYPTSDVVLEI
ncbi:MAG: hybrid-cluster NAD(P)-dependent oxidoreductase [Methyloglobulus sp.]|nr:hybrid-cluster NAD(P)-dependent oxidoreductase [Methyloglobulus sp.]